MDFFDDETSRAPADAAGPPAPPSRRRPPDRRRTRIQRLVIAVIVAFLVVFGLAWWARSCQHNRKVGTYETYFEGVTTDINDSIALGKQVSSIMYNPAKLSQNELVDKLGQLAAQQDEIAVRAARLVPPATLEQEQADFASGMKVRAKGFSLLRTALLGALANKKVTAYTIAALDGYFSGPDAYYQQLVYTPSREIMAKDDVTGVAVPTSTYYLTWKALDPVQGQGDPRPASASPPSSPASTAWRSSASPRRPAAATSSSSRARPTTCPRPPTSASSARCRTRARRPSATSRSPPLLTVPGGDPLKQQGTIAVIEPTKTQTVTISGFAIPETALSKEVTLKVTAGPVKGEHVAHQQHDELQAAPAATVEAACRP